MPSAPQSPEPVRVQRAVMARTARLVLPLEGQLDRREALLLMRHRVIAPAEEDSDGGEAACISAGAAAQPHGEPAGPLIFYRDPAGAGSVVRVRDLLLDRSAELRRIAADHLQRLVRLEGSCSQLVSEAIRADAAAVRAEDAESWGPAAVRLADAVDGDWLLQVAGIRQSRPRKLKTAWNTYINSAARPTAAGILACSPRTLCPQRHAEEFKDHLGRWGRSDVALAEVLKEYAGLCLHLPLGGSFSLAAILKERRGGPEEWAQLREWAAAGGPLARFHACHASISNHAALSESSRDEVAAGFWHIILEHLPHGAGARQRADWRLLHELAAYFVQYLELRLQSDDGEAVAAMGWWMAARLEEALRGDDDDVHAFAEQFGANIAAVSGGVWQLMGQRMRPSIMRLFTLDGPSPWSVALLAAVSSTEQVRWLLEAPGPGSRDDRLQAMGFIAMETRLLLAGADAAPYAFAGGVGAALKAALPLVQDPDAAGRLRAASLPLRWSDLDLGDLLKDILGYEPLMRQWLCRTIRRQAQAGDLKPNALWDVLSGTPWREGIWPQLPVDGLTSLGYTLTDLAVLHRPAWALHLPHLLAEVAERRARDEQSRDAALGVVVRAACALHAGSAVRRIRRGSEAHRFRKAAAEISATLEALLPHAGGWAAGHIRATLTDLAS